MFSRSYFGGSYFGSRYFGRGGILSAINKLMTVTSVATASRIRLIGRILKTLVFGSSSEGYFSGMYFGAQYFGRQYFGGGGYLSPLKLIRQIQRIRSVDSTTLAARIRLIGHIRSIVVACSAYFELPGVLLELASVCSATLIRQIQRIRAVSETVTASRIRLIGRIREVVVSCTTALAAAGGDATKVFVDCLTSLTRQIRRIRYTTTTPEVIRARVVYLLRAVSVSCAIVLTALAGGALVVVSECTALLLRQIRRIREVTSMTTTARQRAISFIRAIASSALTRRLRTFFHEADVTTAASAAYHRLTARIRSINSTTTVARARAFARLRDIISIAQIRRRRAISRIRGLLVTAQTLRQRQINRIREIVVTTSVTMAYVRAIFLSVVAGCTATLHRLLYRLRFIQATVQVRRRRLIYRLREVATVCIIEADTATQYLLRFAVMVATSLTRRRMVQRLHAVIQACSAARHRFFYRIRTRVIPIIVDRRRIRHLLHQFDLAIRYRLRLFIGVPLRSLITGRRIDILVRSVRFEGTRIRVVIEQVIEAVRTKFRGPRL